MPEGAKDVATKASAAAIGSLIGTAVGPIGAFVGAAVGPLLEPIMARVWDELVPDSRMAAQQVLVQGSTHGGVTPDAFAEQIRKDESRRLLGGIAFSAGSRTRNAEKIRALGRALADGVLADDDAKIDQMRLILGALDDIEAPHIVVLNYLVNYAPGTDPWSGKATAPSRIDGDEREAVRQGRQPRHSWRVSQLDAARPGFSGSVISLLGTLQRHGLAVAEQNIKKVLDDYQRDAREAAQPRVTSSRPPEFRTQNLELHWTATDLAERVLAYLEANSAPDDA